MPNRIEIALKDGVRDARGERIKREIEHFLHLSVEDVRTIDVFTVDSRLSQEELQQAAAAGPFSDPVIQLWSIDRPLAAGFDYARRKWATVLALPTMSAVRRGRPCST
jgi:phosphoribosylformylglycinamidine synthase